MAERPPWMVPVPGAPAGFESLHAKHAHLDLVTDLAKICPFRATVEAATTPILWSDMQTMPVGNPHNWIGSGRAATFGEYYLKGIGRTQLALQWNDDSDLLHSSGIMQPSCALREYFISVLCSELGLEDAIVPCEGLLVRALPEKLRGYAKAIAEQIAEDSPMAQPCALDENLQAITVKPANFARMSNITWLAFHAGYTVDRSFLGSLVRNTWLGLGGCPERAGSITSDDLARRFAAVTNAGVHNLLRAWEHGIDWGSLGNNFSLDGRFLDLETPSVFRTPYLGVERDMAWELPSTLSLRTDRLPGCAVWNYSKQCRDFVQVLVHRMRGLASAAFGGSGPAAAYCEQFCSSFEAMQAEALIYNTEELRNRIEEAVTQAYPDAETPEELVAIAHGVNGELAREVVFERGEWSRMAQREEYSHCAVYMPRQLMARMEEPNRVSDTYNEVLLGARAIATADELLAYIRSSETRLREACREKGRPKNETE